MGRIAAARVNAQTLAVFRNNIERRREFVEDQPYYHEWIALSPEARNAFCDHTRECDFPETSADIHTLAVRAGFTECREVNHPPRRYLWSLAKALSQTRNPATA
jgi:hypothetical protein